MLLNFSPVIRRPDAPRQELRARQQSDRFVTPTVTPSRLRSSILIATLFLFEVQNAAHRGAPDIEAAGDLSFADAGTVELPDLAGMFSNSHGPGRDASPAAALQRFRRGIAILLDKGNSNQSDHTLLCVCQDISADSEHVANPSPAFPSHCGVAPVLWLARQMASTLFAVLRARTKSTGARSAARRTLVHHRSRRKAWPRSHGADAELGEGANRRLDRSRRCLRWPCVPTAHPLFLDALPAPLQEIDLQRLLTDLAFQLGDPSVGPTLLSLPRKYVARPRPNLTPPACHFAYRTPAFQRAAGGELEQIQMLLGHA